MDNNGNEVAHQRDRLDRIARAMGAIVRTQNIILAALTDIAERINTIEQRDAWVDAYRGDANDRGILDARNPDEVPE